MIPPIRWHLRWIPAWHESETGHAAKILQYQTASGEWVDVPVVGGGW